MIHDYRLPESGQFFHSFIGLINSYLRYALYFVIILKPFRKLWKQHLLRPIPTLSWTPQLINQFKSLKEGVISTPLLHGVHPDTSPFTTRISLGWTTKLNMYFLSQFFCFFLKLCTAQLSHWIVSYTKSILTFNGYLSHWQSFL